MISRSASPPVIPSKWVWTNDDFPKMDFHLVEIRGTALVNDFPTRTELTLDLDYIVQWDPEPSGDKQGFWVSPSTFAFKEVFELKMNVNVLQPGLTLDHVERKEHILR